MSLAVELWFDVKFGNAVFVTLAPGHTAEDPVEGGSATFADLGSRTYRCAHDNVGGENRWSVRILRTNGSDPTILGIQSIFVEEYTYMPALMGEFHRSLSYAELIIPFSVAEQNGCGVGFALYTQAIDYRFEDTSGEGALTTGTRDDTRYRMDPSGGIWRTRILDDGEKYPIQIRITVDRWDAVLALGARMR